MSAQPTKSCTAFADSERFASGDLREVASKVKQLVDAGDERTVLVFDDATSEPVELDLRGTVQDVLAHLADVTGEGASGIAGAVGGRGSGTSAAGEEGSDAAAALPGRRTPGRPKLGVVGREVTLLPRHWEWLNAQPGGASVALRKLVEHARRDNVAKDRLRCSQEAAYRFMSAMAGNEAGFEEASRALFAGDSERFDTQTES